MNPQEDRCTSMHVIYDIVDLVKLIRHLFKFKNCYDIWNKKGGGNYKANLLYTRIFIAKFVY